MVPRLTRATTTGDAPECIPHPILSTLPCLAHPALLAVPCIVHSTLLFAPRLAHPSFPATLFQWPQADRQTKPICRRGDAGQNIPARLAGISPVGPAQCRKD